MLWEICTLVCVCLFSLDRSPGWIFQVKTTHTRVPYTISPWGPSHQRLTSSCFISDTCPHHRSDAAIQEGWGMELDRKIPKQVLREPHLVPQVQHGVRKARPRPQSCFWSDTCVLARGKKSQDNSRSSAKVGSKMEVSERGSDPSSLPPRDWGTAQGKEGSNSRRTGIVGRLARWDPQLIPQRSVYKHICMGHCSDA